MTAAEKLANNTTITVISRISVIVSGALMSMFLFYYVQDYRGKADALESAQNQIVELQRWKDATQMRIDNELSRLADEIRSLKQDTRADLQLLRSSSERLTAAVEGISAQLKMMQSRQASVALGLHQ